MFYDSVLGDPLLQPLFGEGQAQHVEHLTMFTAETFGGPDRFTRELGFQHLIDVHRGLAITERQRERFVELYMAALDAAGMPDDEPFRAAVREHVEFGTRVAMQNSNAQSDAELTPCARSPAGRGRANARPSQPAGTDRAREASAARSGDSSVAPETPRIGPVRR